MSLPKELPGFFILRVLSFMKRLLQAYYLIQELPDIEVGALKSRLHHMLSGNFTADHPSATIGMKNWLPDLRDYYSAYVAYKETPKLTRKSELADVVAGLQRNLEDTMKLLTLPPPIVTVNSTTLFTAPASKQPPLQIAEIEQRAKEFLKQDPFSALLWDETNTTASSGPRAHVDGWQQALQHKAGLQLGEQEVFEVIGVGSDRYKLKVNLQKLGQHLISQEMSLTNRKPS